MIQLNLDWREVLWWMQGGMAGSHLRWSVYEDMVNRVWPQADEQERRNMFLIMRRDLGTYWRPDGWNGHSHMQEKGEGPWKPAAGMITYSDDKRYDPTKCVTDLTPWMYFRQVLARFDPDNQYRVELKIPESEKLERMLQATPRASIISTPKPSKARRYPMPLKPLIIRAYKWKEQYRIDWSRYCAEDDIIKVEKLEIPNEGTV